MFQFLIGWLQTKNTDSNAQENTMFQFLIGWLQTFPIVLLTSENIGSFNSLQVGYKLALSGGRLRVNITEFQFLIGWLQT